MKLFIQNQFPNTLIDKMPNNIQIRFFLFLFGCIGSRLALTAVSAFASGWFLQLLGLLALIPVIGWFYIIFIGKRDTGLETLGDKIWWKDLRPIHMLLWFTFSWLALHRNRSAWIVLLVDTLFGLIAFLTHHYSEGNFSKLLE
jgi:hypothetical protein